MGAYASAYALTTGSFSLVTIRVASLVSGDIFLEAESRGGAGGDPDGAAGGGDSRQPVAAEKSYVNRGNPMHDLTPRWPRWVLGRWSPPAAAAAGHLSLLHLHAAGATLLPDGFTLDWYLKLWGDPRFLAAFGRSLLVCFATLLLGTLVLVPTVLVVAYYFPRLDPWMNLLILLPSRVPPVVSSVGLLQIYADGVLPIIGTPWIPDRDLVHRGCSPSCTGRWPAALQRGAAQGSDGCRSICWGRAVPAPSCWW